MNQEQIDALVARVPEVMALDASIPPAPWHNILPEGKYYGTRILAHPQDDSGIKVWGFGERRGIASERDGTDDICDSHYEDQGDYEVAEFIVMARALLPDMAQAVAQLQAQVRQLREALLAVEWIYAGEDQPPRCAWCWVDNTGPHATDCPRQAALAHKESPNGHV